MGKKKSNKAKEVKEFVMEGKKAADHAYKWKIFLGDVKTKMEWKENGMKKSSINIHDLYFLQFKNGSNLDDILNNGHTYNGSNCMKLERWFEDLNLLNKPNYTTQIWFKLWNIPAHMYKTEVISHFAGLLGKPLYMDPKIEGGEHLSFARINIELNPHSTFPNNMTVVDKKGKSNVMGITYECRPDMCEFCNTFQHASTKCAEAMEDEQKILKDQEAKNQEKETKEFKSKEKNVEEEKEAETKEDSTNEEKEDTQNNQVEVDVTKFVVEDTIDEAEGSNYKNPKTDLEN
ncbi:uncharacterized protein LOC124909547 [Impatiens glandulifera]|uniref:uncharacterized protein LOC124909547 n=1 Tax=Impatiens glandulifera TaxID=253017 RepID=UPI001FB16E67|nr:uncharacterized protein LOC124909547 [Impatiens glandulifera]